MKVERLLSILLTLLIKKKVIAKDLAELYHVTTRTIYRDMETLSLSGIPIYTERGQSGGFFIDQDFTLDGFLLTAQERQTLLNLSQNLAEITNLAEIESISKKLEPFKTAKSDTFLIDFSQWEINSEPIELIDTAIQESKKVSFSYTSYLGEESQRLVCPLNLVYKANHWYLYGFCQNREAYRLFRVSRIRDLQPLATTFVNHYQSICHEDLNSLLTNLEPAPEIQLVELHFTKQVKAKVLDLFSEDEIKEQADQLMVRKKMPINDWLVSLILGFQDAATVILPTSLKNDVKLAAEKIVAQYDNQLS